MTKQDILKAIENGESVWIIGYGYNNVFEIKLTNKCFIKDNFVYFENKEGYSRFCFYKTKAEAEHYLHHANVTRTEQLPFYTFSEIAKDEKNFKMGKTYTLIEDKNFVLDINKSYVSQIVLYTGKEKYSWNFNEENFYKAYDECVRLFKGEE